MLRASTEAAQGTSFDAMVAHQQQVAAIVRQEPDVAVALSNVGRGRATRPACRTRDA